MSKGKRPHPVGLRRTVIATGICLLVVTGAVLLIALLGGELPSVAGEEAPVSITDAPSLPEYQGELYLLNGQSLELDGVCSTGDSAVAGIAGSTVTAVGAGETELIVCDGAGADKCWRLRVSDYVEIDVPMGRETMLYAENPCRTWYVDDPLTASVEGGLISPAATGECTVTATDDNGRLYGWRVTVKKAAYLTFDDWPNKNTVSILETLDHYGIKATFFIASRANNLEYYQLVIDAGHTIGNHSRRHEIQEMYQSADAAVRDIHEMDEWLMERYDIETKLLRFPGGSLGSGGIREQAYHQLKEEGYRIFDWTCCVGDAETYDTELMLWNTRRELNDDVEVVLMHNKATTAKILPEIIDYLIENNYMMLPLDEECPTYSYIEGWQTD